MKRLLVLAMVMLLALITVQAQATTVTSTSTDWTYDFSTKSFTLPTGGTEIGVFTFDAPLNPESNLGSFYTLTEDGNVADIITITNNESNFGQVVFDVNPNADVDVSTFTLLDTYVNGMLVTCLSYPTLSGNVGWINMDLGFNADITGTPGERGQIRFGALDYVGGSEVPLPPSVLLLGSGLLGLVGVSLKRKK